VDRESGIAEDGCPESSVVTSHKPFQIIARIANAIFGAALTPQRTPLFQKICDRAAAALISSSPLFCCVVPTPINMRRTTIKTFRFGRLAPGAVS
jgi:hypothetical protein